MSEIQRELEKFQKLDDKFMPDFDFKPTACFISSKDGEHPVSFRVLFMKSSSLYCFSVSMVSPIDNEYNYFCSTLVL